MFYFMYSKMRDATDAIGRKLFNFFLGTERRCVLTGYTVILLTACIPIVNYVGGFFVTGLLCMYIWEDVCMVTRDIDGTYVFNMEIYEATAKTNRMILLLYYPYAALSVVCIAWYCDMSVYSLWPIFALAVGVVTLSAIADAVRRMAVRYKFEREN